MIDQNTIISMLNEVVPQMQKSEDPETTLIKYAKEQNLPPSVLERMCHAFNQLKTNCFMDAADTMEKRGSQFSLIDAPELIKRYTDFAGENVGADFDKHASDALDFWGIGEKRSFKIASEKEKEEVSKIDDLFVVKPGDEIFNDFVKSAFEKELDSVKDIEEEKPENFIYKVAEVKANEETLDEYITYLQLKQEEIVNNVKKAFIRDEDNLAKFASFEADAIYLDEDVKDNVDSFINEVSHKNHYIKENIKRAGEIKKHLIKEIHPITQALLDYTDNQKCLKVATQTKEAFSWDPDSLTPVEGLFDTSNKSKNILSNINKEELNALGDLVSANPKAQVFTDNRDKVVGVSSDGSMYKTIQEAAEAAVSNLENKKAEKEEAKEEKRIEKLDKALESFVGNSGKSLLSTFEDLKDNSSTLLNKALMTPQKEHSKLQRSLNKFYNKASDALFNKIMLTDPILSKLSGMDLDNVVEAYATYKQQYPELAFQPALLKSILRGAAQVDGGEDINSLKELVEARKELADARLKELALKTSTGNKKYLF